MRQGMEGKKHGRCDNIGSWRFRCSDLFDIIYPDDLYPEHVDTGS